MATAKKRKRLVLSIKDKAKIVFWQFPRNMPYDFGVFLYCYSKAIVKIPYFLLKMEFFANNWSPNLLKNMMPSNNTCYLYNAWRNGCRNYTICNMLHMRSCWCHAHYNYRDFFYLSGQFLFLQRGPDNRGSTVLMAT